MSTDSVRPVIVKRVKKGSHAAHGGAWKIAYADFVTAMMAFFILMWLLGSTAQSDLDGIADHFENPAKVAMLGGSGVGDATSIIKGGGTDLSRKVGQVNNGNIDPQDEKASKKQQIQQQFEILERQQFEDLKQVIDKAIDNSPRLSKFKDQLLMDITAEGLRIQILDEKNRPMFDVSSSEPKPYAKDMLHEIGKMLNTLQNRVSLSGHTDAAGYSARGAGGFSNWELSSNRANASRRELVAGGLSDRKVIRVIGSASAVLFDPNDPLNPANRRITIIVLNKKSEESILQDAALQDAELGAPGSQSKQIPGISIPKPPGAGGMGAAK